MKHTSVTVDIVDMNQLISIYHTDKLFYRDSIRFTCVKCGKTVITRIYHGLLPRFSDGLTCRKCHIMASPEEYNRRILKGRESYKLKTGFDNPMHNPECVEKLKNTMITRSDEEKRRIINKIENTKLIRYNNSKYNNSDKMHKTKLKKYGDSNYCDRDKLKRTNLLKYGTEYPSQNDTIKNKIRLTHLARTGKCTNLITPEQIERTKRIKIETRGTLSLTTKYYYFGLYFCSSWELAIWIYHIDHHIPIIQNKSIRFEYHDMSGTVHLYEPDFIINGKLIEIKGSQYFRPDGTMKFPYTKFHYNSSLLTPEEKAYYDDLYERKHQCGLQHGVEFWKEEDCKLYIDYCKRKFKHYITNKHWYRIFFTNNPLNPSYWCFNISNPGYYQPQYYVPIQDKGATLFDKPDKDGYILKGKSISPYDLVPVKYNFI